MNTIVAIVTLYQPNSTVAENIKKLSEQVSAVILTDNTPNTDNSELFEKLKNTKYIANKENLGLSIAFNRCMNIDIVKNSDYIIFFDQDSYVTEKQISSLVNDFEIISENHKIGCIGPQYFDTNKNEITEMPKSQKSIGHNCFSVNEIITSSMLTKYSILTEVHFFNERIFLDYADFDLCWRLKQRGYLICQTSNTHFKHSMGKGSTKMFLPIKNKNLIISYWNPFRQYYQTRDSIKLFFKPYIPKQWKKNFFLNNTIVFIMYLYYLPEKKERLKYYTKGFFHGLTGINGALECKQGQKK